MGTLRHHSVWKVTWSGSCHWEHQDIQLQMAMKLTNNGNIQCITYIPYMMFQPRLQGLLSCHMNINSLSNAVTI